MASPVHKHKRLGPTGHTYCATPSVDDSALNHNLKSSPFLFPYKVKAGGGIWPLAIPAPCCSKLSSVLHDTDVLPYAEG